VQGNTRVKFFAKLGDGSEHPFEVDTLSLLHGDVIAHAFAVESQRRGEIPPGDILTVRRARWDE
jgi:hypothetical protein